MSIRASLIVAASIVSFMTIGAVGEAAAQLHQPQETVAGGVAGAIIGGIVGHQNDETAEGVAIGGVVGAITGNLLGQSKDRQIREQYQYQQAVRHEQAQIQQAQQLQFQRAISIDDAITLSRNGVGSQLILNQIHSNGVAQEIGVSEIIAMSQNGVSEVVIDAMQKASVGGPSPVVVGSGPVIVDRGPVLVDRPVIVDHRPVVVARPTVSLQVPINGRYGKPGKSYRGHPSRHARHPGYGPTIRIR